MNDTSSRVLSEQALTSTQASRALPSDCPVGRPHPATIIRWIQDGIRVPGGDRVRLEAVRLGSRWVTSREALRRFADRLTASRLPASPAMATESSAAAEPIG